jgi:hypothetical protein
VMSLASALWPGPHSGGRGQTIRLVNSHGFFAICRIFGLVG